MRDSLEILQQRYGERFGGMQLKAAETIYWPVYRHKITYSVLSMVPLSVVEEGLLRVVQAGIYSLDEISELLGAGAAYLSLLVRRMAETWRGMVRPPLALGANTYDVIPGPGLDEALRLCQRTVADPKDALLLRDGIFGTWLDYGTSRFRVVAVPTMQSDGMRWLGSFAESRVSLDPNVIRASMTAAHQVGECHTEFSEQGALGWVELKLGVYQARDNRRGRFLAFNEKQDDEPLAELSERFERFLSDSNNLPLYFPDDRFGTAKAFWNVLASGVRTVSADEQLHSALGELAVAKDAYHGKIQTRRSKESSQEKLAIEYTEGILEANAWIQEKADFEVAFAYRQAVSSLLGIVKMHAQTPASPEITLEPIIAQPSARVEEDLIRKLEMHDKDSRYFTEDFAAAAEQLGQDLSSLLRDMVWDLRELGRALGVQERASEVDKRLFEGLRNAQDRILKLQARVEQAPSVGPLETKDHPEVLRRALKEATDTIVIFSPWIKMRVVDELLSDMELALQRGCEIWIGYGMPVSRTHEDQSDPKALEALRNLVRSGRLFLVDLSRDRGTHAKEVVCDDKFYAVTSFNWLSYSGKDGRRETGLLVSGSSFVRERLNQSIRSLTMVQEATDNPRAHQRSAPTSRPTPLLS